MVIQHDLLAMNANNMLMKNNKKIASIDFSQFTPDKLQDLIGKGFYTICFSHYSIQFVDKATSSMETSGDHLIYSTMIDPAEQCRQSLQVPPG